MGSGWRWGLAVLVGVLGPWVGGSAFGEEGGAIRFREVSVEWGIGFRHHHGGSGDFYLIETMGAGVVALDYDGDGDDDLFFVQSGELPGTGRRQHRSVLYRNDGAGRFAEVSAGSGVELDVYGMGAAAGDIDGDGDLDLYVTCFGADRLLRNNGDGTFTDVTEASGVANPDWGASASFADVDRDGDLDLYVTNYVDFTLERHKFCGNEETGLQGYCHPSAYEGEPDRFYRNRGDGTFVDDTALAGFSGATEAGLGVVFGDLNDDGWPDLYVANDADPNFLFLNRGDGTFKDVSLLSGSALNEEGRPEGGMGVDLGDVDGDGRLDILVTNFEFESNALYQNLGSGLFVDKRFAFNLAEPSLRYLAFGVALSDFDHDADLDVVIANGHILDNAPQFNELSVYAQRNQLFENLGDGRFRELASSGLDSVRVSRGLASGDLDGDGDLDLVICNSNDRAEVYENLSATGNRSWLLVDLVGRGGNRFGVDARVSLVGAERRQVREVRTASSYLSQNPLTLHFGLGEAPRVETLVVLWPSGKSQRIVDPPRNKRLKIWER